MNLLHCRIFACSRDLTSMKYGHITRNFPLGGSAEENNSVLLSESIVDGFSRFEPLQVNDEF